jgi:hypothetical protein
MINRSSGFDDEKSHKFKVLVSPLGDDAPIKLLKLDKRVYFFIVL